MPDLEVRRIGYALGAEVTGIDLSRPLGDETVRRIRQAWVEHIMLCFPGQDLTPSEQVAFCSYFGEVDSVRSRPHLRTPEHPGVTMIVSRPVMIRGKLVTPAGGERWHSDGAYTDRPTTGTFLLSKELPDIGGDTMFANMHMAFETLSAGFKRLIEPLEGLHDLSRFSPQGDPAKLAEWKRENPPIVHPLVSTHPETGRRALYLGGFLQRFAGMTEEESQPILDQLYAHATRYEFVYRHRWRLHDLVMWDNRSAMHMGVPDFDRSQIRTLQRCVLIGPRSGRLFDAIDPT